MTAPVIGSKLLKNRYELVAGPGVDRSGSRVWTAFSSGDRYLVKTWPYEGETPDRVQRALWDQELRMLYKLASSPRADKSLVLLKDAGLDRDYNCFVMVLDAPGYERLAGALRTRSRHSWLSDDSQLGRRAVWSGLAQIATGLELLHERQILHRGVDVDSLFFDEDLGPESLRLGGFEWSVKLGRPVGAEPPRGWSMPPQQANGSIKTWGPNDDWFAFGILCARMVLDIERFADNPPAERYERTAQAVKTASRQLTEPERKLILELIAEEPLGRLATSYDILQRIQEIVYSLGHPRRTLEQNEQYIVALNLGGYDFVDHLLASGLREHLGLGVTETFNPADLNHRTQACEFVRQDMRNALIYARPGYNYYILVGGRLSLKITPYRGRDNIKTWRVADCRSVESLRFSKDDESFRELPEGRVFAYSRNDVYQDVTITQRATAWDLMLPKVDRSSALSLELAQFHDFLKASNQIELLLLDSQIFAYEIVGKPQRSEGEEYIVVRERERPEGTELFDPFQIGLIDFLQKEARDSTRSKVILTPVRDGDRLKLPSRDRRLVEDDNVWQVAKLYPDQQLVQLSRAAVGDDMTAPEKLGFLRSAGMPGQISLFQRRKKAIDALDQHGYLLRSLASTSRVRMDTGAAELPVDLDHDLVDEPKRASIEDILRVRPIYTLQGPPGTGKTTLVAWLLREIVSEDPVVQVLVTAQAHGAVDVLRSKVGEAFRGVPEEERPLEIRLRSIHKTSPESSLDGAEGVAKQVLDRSIRALNGMRSLSAVQKAWLEDATSMIAEIEQIEQLGTLGRRSADFVELVKRGANLTYCTTSAGDLVALAAGQAFDWSIVEEAGKAHGFDLALPLQAGHRWLLIGDHKQLNPYRYKDYLEGINKLDTVTRILKGMRGRDSGLVDRGWIDSWEALSSAERDDFRHFADKWLKTFAHLFERCTLASGESELLTDTRPKGASAGQLVGQHRMHPTIGKLISGAYYEGRLDNRTAGADGRPIDRVRHKFTQPSEIADRAVVWLDVPWCGDGADTREMGPDSSKPPYTNPAEARALANFLRTLGPDCGYSGKLAVLAPYARQVKLLREHLREVELPDGLTPQHSLNDRAEGFGFPTHTVDSFQGNQADVVAVSLVRNNEKDPGKGLGFLDDPGRMNVLLSRAERLLILVGSWDFFVRQTQHVLIADTSQKLWSMKKIVSLVGDWFETGEAVRIAADLKEQQ